MDLYELLGLARGATLVEIKRSYRRLARKYHPDINPGDRMAEAHFKEITRAYETLSNPDLRHRYDLGATLGAAVSATVEFEGFDFSPSGAQSPGTTFGDIFSEIFSHRGEPRSSSGPEAGVDLHANLSLAFDEAMHGAQRQL